MVAAQVFEICISAPPIAHRVLYRMGLQKTVTFTPIPVLAKDSLDITGADQAKIAQACLDANTSKIIITHGTDTMRDTAEVLTAVVPPRRTVVLTGALLPAGMYDSDAEFNLGMAVSACLFAPPGIYIAMNGVHDWRRCAKDSESGIFVPTPEPQ